MQCKKCGKELEENWKICPECGEIVHLDQQNEKEKYGKKPVYKRVWFWILVVFACFVGLGIYGSSLPDEDTEKETAKEAVEKEVTDFSEYDLKELLAQAESGAESIGLKRGEQENVYAGLNGSIQVVYDSGAVQKIQIKGEAENTPSLYGVKIGMAKTETTEKLAGNYPETTETEAEQKFMNLETKESVICSIAEDKVNEITYQKLSDDEVAEYEKAKEEQLRAYYIFPDSDKQYLSEDEVRSVEADKLWIGRNEVFARHGYIFENETLRQHFESMPWYQGTVPSDQFNADSVFNDFEKKNVELIKKVEDEINGNAEEQAAIDGAYNFIAGKTFHKRDTEMRVKFKESGEFVAVGYYSTWPEFVNKYASYSITARYEVYRDDQKAWLTFINIEGVEYYLRYFEGGSINLAGYGEFDGWYDLTDDTSE